MYPPAPLKKKKREKKYQTNNIVSIPFGTPVTDSMKYFTLQLQNSNRLDICCLLYMDIYPFSKGPNAKRWLIVVLKRFSVVSQWTADANMTQELMQSFTGASCCCTNCCCTRTCTNKEISTSGPAAKFHQSHQRQLHRLEKGQDPQLVQHCWATWSGNTCKTSHQSHES